MKSHRVLFIAIVLILCAAAHAQVSRIVIPAGTPEDKALQAISAEPNAQARIPMLEKFLAEFAANKDAVAFGNWQLSQTYSAVGENDKALAFGEKALAASPNNLEIVVSVTSIADILKDREKTVDFASRGGTVYHSIAQQSKPAEKSAEDWANQIATEQGGAKANYEYLEATAYNAIAAESNGKQRLALIEKYNAAFPASRFEEPISQLAMASLQEMNDPAKVLAFGEKALKTNPESVPTLMLLANSLIEDPKNLEKAVAYAAKAVKFAKITPESTPQQKLTAGLARSTYGYALLKQEKAALAVPELKQAVDLLGDQESVKAEALFRLGFAYAKLNKRAEAKDMLEKAVAIDGPYKPIAQDMLNKVNSAPTKKR